MSTPEYRPATALVAALAGREVSAEELLDGAIAAIEARDGGINAVVVRDFDRARTAARQADAALARGERRPLLGLPMTVKESFNVAGLPTTWGNVAARDTQIAEDAVPVQRLKAAGAVVIGKTNVPINLGDWQAYNDLYGVTRNPWDPGRSPGGSSGGGAAAVAAGFVALELGSDIGGSLRAPAQFCGVFSHKPSHALVASRGHSPPGAPPTSVEPDLAVIGPLARSADDLALALGVLAGPDAPLARGYRLELPEPRHTSLDQFRVLVLAEHPLVATSASVAGPIERLAARLAARGAKVDRAARHVPDLVVGARIYMQMLMAFLGANFPEPVYRGIAAEVAGIPADADTLEAWRGRGVVSSFRDWLAASRVRAAQQRQWAAVFRDWDVVLAPPMPTPAFAHDHSPDMRMRMLDIDGVAHPFSDQLVWAGPATLAGLPATTLPLERTDAGLPTGVQVIGPFLEDRTTIAFAQLVERAFGGFVPPPR